MIFEIEECEQKLGYSFKDKMLLRKCFTHASYSNEHGTENNELLEFFGDAIIQYVVTEYLVNSVSGNEGYLTDRRKEIVSKEPLLKSIKKLGIGQFILLGKGQEENLSYREKLFSSLYEALVAGIYIDGGLKECKKFINRTIILDFQQEQVKKNKKKKGEKDGKSLFQEYVQKYKLGSITYELLGRSGPDHDPVFRVGALLNGKQIGEASGKTKKSAEAESALKAIKKLKEEKQGK
ncbi:MAG: ribonuclease III [Firmicutes bacterium]|nr:ribonuclease III [Candidatus Caballimonas caccae]